MVSVCYSKKYVKDTVMAGLLHIEQFCLLLYVFKMPEK
jgi:hypothetical protein